MDNQSKALSHISDALSTLEDARSIISELLINRPAQSTKRELEILQDLHKRVTQAITVLPHSGRNTSNCSKGSLEDRE